MGEETPRKRSQILADENLRNIAERLRVERNEALVQAQNGAEIVAQAVALLGEARRHLTDEELVRRIDEFMADSRLGL